MLRATGTVDEMRQCGSTNKMSPPRSPGRGGRVCRDWVRLVTEICGSGLLAGAAVLVALSVAPARAEQDVTRAAPRAAVEIGGASVVLVVANDQIYAFVDGVADNAPLSDAALGVDLADGSSLRLARVSPGLFVAPFSRTGHMQDAFMVSLASSDASGEGAVELLYDEAPAPEAPAVGFDMRVSGAIAVVAGAIGVALTGAVLLLSRTRRRRAARSLAGSAMVRF